MHEESPKPTPGELTRLLVKIGEGEEGALAALWQQVHEEVRQLAGMAVVGERPSPTIQPTMLVNEVFLRLHEDPNQTPWRNRGHFFGSVARAMSRVLIDAARRRGRIKRGGDRRRVSLEVTDHELSTQAVFESDNVGELFEAVDALEEEAPRAAEVVWLRYVADLTSHQIAGVLGISPRTVGNDWLYAKAYLRQRLGSAKADS